MIYENIVRLCKERNVSVARLEKECGFGNATIRGWAVSSPSINRAQRVAEFFNISIDELIGEEKGGESIGNE